MERIFQVIAVLLAATAGYFYWAGNEDGLYISAVLGCVAFFFNVRTQVKKRNDELDAARDAEREPESNETQSTL